jgi:threonine dehydrogenase-like Zn-dependent dehydrogenase
MTLKAPAQETAAFWITGPCSSEIRRGRLNPPGPGELRIKTLFSGISRGTETLVYRGEVPQTEYRSMRAPFQEGEFPAPVKYGYCSVGQVVARGPASADDGANHKGADSRVVPQGQRVFCLYPHQNEYNIPEAAALPLPTEVPPQRAVLGANMETALNALWDASPLPGDRVSVVGAGALGCLLASLLLRSLGLNLELIDVNPELAPVADHLGARLIPPEQASLHRDIVFHASASEAGLRHCLELCRPGGRLLELSWYGNRTVTLPLGQAFHSKRIQLLSSQVGTVSPNKPGWTHRERLGFALSLLTDDRLDALVSPPYPFESLPWLFQALNDPEGASDGLLPRSTHPAPALCIRHP